MLDVERDLLGIFRSNVLQVVEHAEESVVNGRASVLEIFIDLLGVIELLGQSGAAENELPVLVDGLTELRTFVTSKVAEVRKNLVQVQIHP